MFPHEGKLVTVDQLSFTRKGHLETNESPVPLIDQSKWASETFGSWNVYVTDGNILYTISY